MGISLVEMYFMLKNDEFESDKVEKYQSNFKAGVYFGLFLVALCIYLYVLTYYEILYFCLDSFSVSFCKG